MESKCHSGAYPTSDELKAEDLASMDTKQPAIKKETTDLASSSQIRQSCQTCHPQAACHPQISRLNQRIQEAQSQFQEERHERLLLQKQHRRMNQQLGNLSDQYAEVCQKYMLAHTAMCNLEECCKELDFHVRSESTTRLEVQTDLQQERFIRKQIQTKQRHNAEATQNLAGIIHMLMIHRAELSEDQRSEIEQRKFDFTSLVVDREHLKQERDDLRFLLLRERDGHRKREGYRNFSER